MKSKRGTKTPLGRTPLKASATPEVGRSTESRNSVFPPAPPRFPGPTSQEPAARPTPTRRAGGAHARECPRSRPRTYPAAQRPDAAYPPTRRIGQSARDGPDAGRPARGREEAAPPCPAPRPPHGYTEGRPRAQPAFCSAAARALLSARTSEAAAAPSASRSCGPRHAPAARPPPPPRRGPSTAPVSCQVSGHAEGPPARGGLGRRGRVGRRR